MALNNNHSLTCSTPPDELLSDFLWKVKCWLASNRFLTINRWGKYNFGWLTNKELHNVDIVYNRGVVMGFFVLRLSYKAFNKGVLRCWVFSFFFIFLIFFFWFCFCFINRHITYNRRVVRCSLLLVICVPMWYLGFVACVSVATTQLFASTNARCLLNHLCQLFVVKNTQQHHITYVNKVLTEY